MLHAPSILTINDSTRTSFVSVVNSTLNKFFAGGSIASTGRGGLFENLRPPGLQMAAVAGEGEQHA